MVAQQTAQTGFRSVGRGAPLAADLRQFPVTGATTRPQPEVRGAPRVYVGASTDGTPPKGNKALPLDLFTT